MQFKQVEEILTREIDKGLLPGACLELGNRNGTIQRIVLGNRSLLPAKSRLNEDTLFDMASCTKLMATSMVAFRLIEEGKLCLHDRMDRFFSAVHPDNRAITIFDLLTHTSGIPPVTSCVGASREDVASHILSMQPAYARGTAVGYACLGYIVLGRLLEMIGESPLDEMARLWFYEPMEMTHTCFCPQGENIAPTNINTISGDVTLGIVNDYNSRALGGITGNAGLFSNLHDCSVFARMLLCEGLHNGRRILSSAMLQTARKNYTQGVPNYNNMNFNNARGLGLYFACASDNPVAELLSPSAYGHTGHTGTSLFVDPENEIYIVLLTSRLHVLGQPTDEIWRIRRLVHNAIAAEM